jgi:hypothetical protein
MSIQKAFKFGAYEELADELEKNQLIDIIINQAKKGETDRQRDVSEQRKR